MELIKFVPEQLMILVAALYVVGMFLKNSPKVLDWSIPWVLLVVGVGGSIALQQGVTALAVFQGIVSTGVAVLTNQLIKQTKNREDE
ncbi:Phage holin family Hol44, holin superfamily V [Clostridium amylolyticum]|uniref:Phage holin family Hol44, holin superfamily V n=1 Tax=Clostridium amylolyticum TaxID=1121298 RepID=A0A1M6EW34_9CLOT|nr:phage holin family protein [Clostridium amylolyticum]SHI89697.1 Phage holin family Hol44, holin superfamily V [Clostridium amylolyticum]